MTYTTKTVMVGTHLITGFLDQTDMGLNNAMGLKMTLTVAEIKDENHRFT